MLAIALSALGWWYSPLSLRAASAPALASGARTDCRLPPQVRAGGPPLQTPVPGSMPPFALQAAQLTPLAGFSVEARVLSREDYRVGREADLSEVDLALGWGRMREDAVLERLDISQGGRFYSYRWQGDPPLPPAEIVRSSANMHMIAADAEVASQLRRVRADQSVRIDGWLVSAQAGDGWQWRSSITREDSGAGACELVYVCAVTTL